MWNCGDLPLYDAFDTNDNHRLGQYRPLYPSRRHAAARIINVIDRQIPVDQLCDRREMCAPEFASKSRCKLSQ